MLELNTYHYFILKNMRECLIELDVYYIKNHFNLCLAKDVKYA